MLANLESALTTYEASPSILVRRRRRGDRRLRSRLFAQQRQRDGQQVREQADPNMASSVSTINSLLEPVHRRQQRGRDGPQTGANVSSAEDTRDTILTQLSQQIGISTVTNANGSESIYTDSGVTLFQDTPRTVSFTPTPTLIAGANGAPVTVDGVPITGPIRRCRSSRARSPGYAALRDTLAPQYQAQLDQIAGGLISAFAESDQSATPALPSLPGLFTAPGATSLPSMSATTGLAAAIEVNPNVDPSQGGNPNLLRDGGISDPATRPTPTTRPARRATPGASSSSSARSARRRASTRPPASARRRASPITPTPR